MSTQPETTNVQPLRTPTQLVSDIVDLQDQISHLSDLLAARKRELGDAVGVGSHQIAGVDVQVREPNRRFDADAAYATLTAEQQAAVMSPDPKKIRAQLAPVVADAFMKPGTGAQIVSVR